MSFDPQTNALYATAWNSPVVGMQGQADFTEGKTYTGAGTSPPIIGAHKYGTLTAMDARTNKIMWQVKNDYATGQGSGFLTTAGGIAFHGNSDGFFQAYDARTGNLLWQWQTGAGADAPAMTYMIDGVQYLSIAAGGVTGNGVRLATWRHAVDLCTEWTEQTAADAESDAVADHRHGLYRSDRARRDVVAAEQRHGGRLRLHAESNPDQSRRYDQVRQQRTHTAHCNLYGRQWLGHRSIGFGRRRFIHV